MVGIRSCTRSGISQNETENWLIESTMTVPIVLSSECEACFEELDYIRCTECDEETYFIAWQRHHGAFDVDCQGCGIRLKA
jgi:hypothetical protein